MGKLIFLIFSLGVVCSCNFYNRQYTKQLEDLDHLLEENPKYVWDSLKKIDPGKLSEAQQAYYHLLNASATDKNLNYLSTDSTLKIALEYYQDGKDLYNLARCQYYIGKFEYKKRNKVKRAYELLKEAEKNFQLSGSKDIHLLGLIQYLLGHVQYQQINYIDAEYLFQNAYKKFMETQDTISAIYAMRYNALMQINKNNYKEAQELLHQSFEISTQIKGDSVKIFQVQIHLQLALSQFYRRINNYNLALEYCEKCISLYLKNKLTVTSKCYSNILKIYKSQNQIDSTEFYCNKMISAAKGENDLINQINGYRILAELKAKNEDFKSAYLYRTQSNLLKDSLNKTLVLDNLLDLERSYQRAENQRLKLKAENIKWKAYTSVTAILLSLLLIGFPVYLYYRKLKAKCAYLSEAIKHTEWGFSVSKEFITENHIDYAELERLFTRLKAQNNLSTEAYNILHEALIQQKAISSGRLFDRLTNFDGNFGSKFQQLFPDVSTDELLLATMIHHQWKISDMSTIFHATVDAIRKRKTRLAHKISLKLKKEIDLDEYLTHF